MRKVSSDPPATGGTSGMIADRGHCFFGVSYSVLNKRSDEIRAQAVTGPSIPGGQIDKTIPPGQMVVLYSSMGLPAGDRCTVPSLSDVFSTLRITAGGKVIYEGVRVADWMANTLVIEPPDTDDAGIDEDAGR